MATNAKKTEQLRKSLSFDSIDVYAYLYRWSTIYLDDEEGPDGAAPSWRQSRRKPFSIEKFPCLIYVIDYKPPDQIRIWLKEEEFQVDKCADYMYERYKANRTEPCWVCKWVKIEPYWRVDLSEDVDQDTVTLPDFYRLHGDREVAYGDGGHDLLCYPVWIQEQLPVNESRRQRLLQTFYALNNERRDCHPSPSPVEDIIDPDLLSYKPAAAFNRHQWIARQRRTLEHDERSQRTFQRDINNGYYQDLSEHEQIRDTYQWIPSEFTIDSNGKVDIQSPIEHLPVLPEYRQTYGDIAQIFHAMLPMFEKLKIIRRNSPETQRLQVIVKAQSYNLRAGMKYSGRWHTEGHTENIVAVGVYYLHIDEELTGGALKFRPQHGPQDFYDHIQTDHVVSSLRTGAAVVFSNCIPHRFQQIQNLTTLDGRRRTFLNFFIVDPDQPIALQSKTIVRSPLNTIVDVLQKWNDQRLPLVALDRILHYLNLDSIWNNENEAKQFRARVRKAMLDEKTGWGWICWGNCGTTEFVRSFSAWPPNKQSETNTLYHTESD